VEPIVRQVIDLNVRYYKALGLATLEYMQGLASFLSRNMRRDAAAPSPFPFRAPRPAPAPAPPAEPASVIVLEAAAGHRAEGAFAVANQLARPVTATIEVSPFRDESGADAHVQVEVSPTRMSLDPGQQVVVHIAAAISDDLLTSIAYRGFVSVPGLSDRPIPILVRRVAAAATAAKAKTRRSRKPASPSRARRR
jgi:hypothetical protein